MLYRLLAFALIAALMVFAFAYAEEEYEAYQKMYFSLVSALSGPEDAATDEERALYVAAILDMEIMNGGLSQFFLNEGEKNAPLVGDSLRLIGLNDAAELYEVFLQEHAIDPCDMSDFQCKDKAELAQMYEKYAFLTEFDDAYMDLRLETGFVTRMLDFARENSEAIPAIE